MTGRAGPRKAAMLAGETHYFTGEPCKRGHIAKRFVSTKICTECASDHRDAHRDEYRAYARNYYVARIDEERERGRKKNEKYREEGKIWPRTPESIAKSDAFFKETHPTYHSEYSKAHYRLNKQSYRATGRKRRALLRNLDGIHHTAEDIKRILRLQKGKCACCKIKVGKKFHADHIMPLKMGGSNEARNIQILCPTCNQSKAARHPTVFMQANGFLL